MCPASCLPQSQRRPGGHRWPSGGEQLSDEKKAADGRRQLGAVGAGGAVKASDLGSEDHEMSGTAGTT